ncbi:acyltransferase [Reichenbachiella versicolor]|uniref:acyltransferase n=1 Tax=Reichenbachiella versicolor TaxID=1821036 RepID=UPI000D6E0318|nr:acyltransferase [Reichenbachiella versicolor]
MSFLTEKELKMMGFKSIGDNVRLSKKASFYNTQNISLGDNSRIDDYCVLSAGKGGIQIGNYVHIAVFCSLIGDGVIKMGDFSGLSSRVSIYSSNDDYSGNYLTNPCVPEQYTNVFSGNVCLEKHVIVGAGSIILPNIHIGLGTAIGALSLVSKNCEPDSIYMGQPAKRIKSRRTGYKELEGEMLKGN